MDLRWAWARYQKLCNFVHTSNRFFWSAVGVSAVATALFALAITANFGGDGVSTAVDDYGEGVAALVASLACVLAGCRTSGRRRLGWILIGAGAGSWFAGEVIWSWIEVVLTPSARISGATPASHVSSAVFEAM